MEEATSTSPASKSKQGPGITASTSAYFVDPSLIDPPPDFNPRIDLGDIEGLAASIAAQLQRDPDSGGLINDLHVRRTEGGRFQVTDGKRRREAIALLLKKGTIFPRGVPVKFVEKNASDRDLLIQMFVANDGKAFTPMEEAAAYKKLRDDEVDAEGKVIRKGMTIQEIGAAVGRKHMHVSQMLALIDADASVKEALSTGKIGKTAAKEIASAAKGDKEKQKVLVAQAEAIGKDAKNKKARRQFKEAVDETKVKKAAKKGRKLMPRRLSEDQLAALGEKLADHLKKLMKEAGVSAEMKSEEYRAIIAKDEKLAAAATFGALEALKACAGLEVGLEF